MATPRKNWFKVPDSICFDSLTNDELACLVRLQAYMNTRWARDGKNASERGKCVVDARMAMTISGKHRPDVALTSLRHLADITSMSVRCEANIASIHWPKYADFQAMDSRESPLPSPNQANTKKEDRSVEAPAAPAATRPKRQRSTTPKTPCPDQLEPEQRAGLRAWAEENGIDPASLKGEWEAMRDHWRGLSEQRADWPASFRTWLRRSKRFAARDEAKNNRESAAQARERRTKEAVREAFNQMTEGQPPLLALPGGRS